MKRVAGISFVLLVAASFALAELGEIMPGDNLVVEGIPKIPASLAQAVDPYTEFRTATLASWHPVRREMLVSTRFSDTPQIHVVKFPGGARTQLTFSHERVLSAYFEPKQGDYFVFSQDVGGGEWFQFYRYDCSTGGVTLLTDGKSRNTGLRWSNAGDRIVYGSTRRNSKDTDFYVMNPTDPKSDHLMAQLENGEAWTPLDWSPDDGKILAHQEVSANESYLWIFDVATGRKMLLTPQTGTEKVAYSGGRFSKDGKGIYTAADRDAEFLRLTYIDLASGQHKYLSTEIPWDVDGLEISWDGKTVAFVTNEDGIGKLHLLDTAAGKEKLAPKLPSGSISNVRWHRNNEDLGFVLVSARSPADVYSYNLRSGKVDRWTYSETGGLNTENFVEPELIRWKSFDGRMISGFLYRPPAKFSGKRPVIINIHGGPEAQFRPGFLARNNYYLNEPGVAIIFPNIRGSSGYGKTFLKLDNGFLREDSYKDISALLDWIRTRPDLDPDRVMVTGGSYGGHMTLAVATNYNDHIRCALDIVGPSNLVTFLEHTEPYRRDLRRFEYGDERDPKMREFLERIAPVNHADKIRTPLFVVAGRNDPRVPHTESEQMVAAVRKNGTPVWYLMAKDEGHGFAKKKNQDFLFYASIEFMQLYLLK